jgi:hypothetical protein
MSYKFTFSETEIRVLQRVLTYVIARNGERINGTVPIVDTLAHAICRDNCQTVLDELITVAGDLR